MFSENMNIGFMKSEQWSIDLFLWQGYIRIIKANHRCIMKKSIIIEAICFLFVFLFIYAAANKLLDFQRFQTQLLQSPVVSSFAGFVAIAVISSEIIVSLMLAVPTFRVTGLYGAFFLMTAFTTYIIVVLNFSFYVPCSCGGILDKMGWTEHLTFNITFCLLAVVGILLPREELKSGVSFGSKPMIKRIATTALGGVMSVVLLNSISKENIKSGDFYRFYPAHSISFSSHLDLRDRYNSIAGTTGSHLFLSSVEMPGQLLMIDHALTKSEPVPLDMSRFEPLRFYSLFVKIDSPYFYVSDGSIPFLLRGQISNWKLTDSLPTPANFKELVPISNASFAVRSLNLGKRENEIGKLVLSNSETRYNGDLLQKQVDGIFCTDGMLRYSASLHQIVYLYYYRNQYIVADSSLALMFRGRTIDTVSRAQVKAAALKYDGHQSNRLINPSAVVNKRSCLYGHWLFVISLVKAKNENDELYETSTGVDVYDIIDHKYLLSFYLPDLGEEKVKDIFVDDDQLFVLYGNIIERYALDQTYFK